MAELIFMVGEMIFGIANNHAHARALAMRKIAPLTISDCEKICEAYGRSKAPQSFAESLYCVKLKIPESEVENVIR